MSIDLSVPPERPGTWESPDEYWPLLTEATAELDPPLAVLDLDALAYNAHDLRRRAGTTPVRVASKSVRSRAVLDAVLALDGYAGVLAYTLAEALWLAEGDDLYPPVGDVVVAYPTVDRAAIARLARSPELAAPRHPHGGFGRATRPCGPGGARAVPGGLAGLPRPRCVVATARARSPRGAALADSYC